jgi:hypothetical protein
MAGLMQSKTESETRRAGPGRAEFLGLAAVFALSPVLWDWTLHLAHTPSARYAALFPILYLIGFRHDSRQAARKDGYLFLALAVVVVILAVGGGFTRWGRIAVPIALIALIRLNGYASLRGSLTLLWFVPLPHFINTLVWPDLILFYSQAMTGLQISQEATNVFIQSSEGGLRVSQGDAGMALMLALSGVSYFVSWQRDESASRTITRLIFSILAALPLQFLAIALALFLLKSGFPQPAQILVNTTIWVVSLAWILIFVPRHTWRPPKHRRG